MSNTTRESGYYWVKCFGEWVAADYSCGNKKWWLPGTEQAFTDADFIEINETRLPSPDEQQRTIEELKEIYKRPNCAPRSFPPESSYKFLAPPDYPNHKTTN